MLGHEQIARELPRSHRPTVAVRMRNDETSFAVTVHPDFCFGHIHARSLNGAGPRHLCEIALV